MTQSNKVTRFVKPAKCECEMVFEPIAPSEVFQRGMPGTMRINGTEYAARVLASRTTDGQFEIDGYRLTKYNGESHDICLVAGRMECTCGDYEFRRAALQNPDVCECKHIKAIRQLCEQPRDMYEQHQANEGGTFVNTYSGGFDDP